MRREGSAFSGVGTVTMKELADNLTSTRMRLLELLIFVTGAGAAYSTIGVVKDQLSEYPFVFLLVFTYGHDPLPSFVSFLGFLIPIVAIALGFDAVNSEFNRRTMSRILAQPIYRDALLIGKFFAGLITLAVVLSALWLLVVGLGILLLGLPPNTDEVLRGFAFLLAAIAYGGVWLALALLFSVIFRSAATAALASLAVWLLVRLLLADAGAARYRGDCTARPIRSAFDTADHQHRDGHRARLAQHAVLRGNTGVPEPDDTRARSGAVDPDGGRHPRHAAAARRQHRHRLAAAHRAARVGYRAVRDRLRAVPAPGSAGVKRRC